ncbi:MAG TPA: response regulator [Tepidisphaeraceae bacterium]
MMPTADKTKILVVEDDEVTQRLFKRILERSGYAVAVADNGIDGFEVAVREHPHLVLLDLMMPELDGFGFLGLLRASPLADLPVIVTSALADSARQTQAFAMGVREFLVKTKFTLNDLVASIQRNLPDRAFR